MSRTKAFLSNTASTLVLQAVTILVGFIVPRIVITCYGSEVNGLVNSLAQFVSYISLVEAGISAAAVYSLYKPIASKDFGMVSVIVSAARKFYYKSGWIFVALTAVLAFVYPLIVDCGDISSMQVALLVVSIGSMGFIDFFTLAKYRVLLTADQRNWVIQLATILYKILYLIIIVVLAYLGFSIEIVYIAAIAPVIVRSMVLAFYTRRRYKEVDFRADTNGYKLEQHWDAFYLQILGVVQSGGPLIIATFVMGNLAAVSVLSVYLLVASGILSVCNALGGGTQATFGNVIAREEYDILQRTFKEFQTLTYTLGAGICGAAFVLILPFVDLYTSGVTDISYHDSLLGFLAILNVYLYHLKTPQGLLVISAGMYKATRIQTSIQTVILLVAAIALGIPFGGPGILVGCCLSNLYRDIDLAFFIPRKLTKTPVSDTFRRMAISILKCSLTALPFVLLNITCANWVEWIGWAVAVVAWGTLVCGGLAFIFERDQIQGLITRIKRLFGRKG